MDGLWLAIAQPVLAIAGAVAAGVFAVYVPRGINILTAHHLISLTENQRQTVEDAVSTAAGILETALDQGLMRVAHVVPDNTQVQQQALAVMSAVPKAAAALDMNTGKIARMIVGRVDTAAHPGQTIKPPGAP